MCAPELVDSSALAVHVASIKLRAIRALQGRLSEYNIAVPDVINGILSEIQEGQGRTAELLADARALAAKYNIDISHIHEASFPNATPAKQWGWQQDLLAVNCEPVGVAEIAQARSLVAAMIGA
jgi:hypothetical protein